jgi:hypothetical protein
MRLTCLLTTILTLINMINDNAAYLHCTIDIVAMMSTAKKKQFTIDTVCSAFL